MNVYRPLIIMENFKVFLRIKFFHFSSSSQLWQRRPLYLMMITSGAGLQNFFFSIHFTNTSSRRLRFHRMKINIAVDIVMENFLFPSRAPSSSDVRRIEMLVRCFSLCWCTAGNFHDFPSFIFFHRFRKKGKHCENGESII